MSQIRIVVVLLAIASCAAPFGSATLAPASPSGEEDGVADASVSVRVHRSPEGMAVIVELHNSRLSPANDTKLTGTLGNVSGGWTFADPYEDPFNDPDDRDCPVIDDRVDCGLNQLWWYDDLTFQYGTSTVCEAVSATFTVTSTNDGFPDNNSATASLESVCGGEAEPTTTPIPVFPSPFAFTLATLGVLGAGLLLARRR